MKLAIVCMILSILPTIAWPQPIVIPITLHDTAGDSAIARFGYHPTATYCIDGVLDSALYEYIFSGPPPGGPTDLLLWFTDPYPRPGQCQIEQTFLDLRAFGVCKPDTFLLRMQEGIAGLPLTLTWPAGLDKNFSSLQILDGLGGLILKINMLEQTSVVVSVAFFRSLYIIAERCPKGTILFPVTIQDFLGRLTRDTLGYHPLATRCIDGKLDNYLYERELPPLQCHATITRFYDGDTANCLGEGVTLDLRDRSLTCKTDYFLLSFCGWNPYVISWHADRRDFDSLRITDEYGGLFIDVDMLKKDSLILTSPAITRLRISAVPNGRCATTDASHVGIVSNQSSLSNYPNPFNSSTTFRFRTNSSGPVLLQVFDLLGRKVADVVNESLPPGEYERTYTATELASGVYYFRLTTDGKSVSQIMMLVR